jgi:hypothetical protein
MLDHCPDCDGPLTADIGWCDACQRRARRPRGMRINRRISRTGPRRWKVRRRYLHLTAAVLSAVIPGGGQVYKDRLPQGVAWLVVVVFAYWLVGLPGMLAHALCVIHAGSAAPRIHRPVPDEIGWERA